MLTAKTIVGLACLMTQGVSLDQIDPNTQLTQIEPGHIVELADQQRRLPASIETLVKETNKRIASNDGIVMPPPLPSRECM